MKRRPQPGKTAGAKNTAMEPKLAPWLQEQIFQCFLFFALPRIFAVQDIGQADLKQSLRGGHSAFGTHRVSF